MNTNTIVIEHALAAVWIYSDTSKGCLHIVDSLHDMQEDLMEEGLEDLARTVAFCRDLAYEKHLLFNKIPTLTLIKGNDDGNA